MLIFLQSGEIKMKTCNIYTLKGLVFLFFIVSYESIGASSTGVSPGEIRVKKEDSMVKVFVPPIVRQGEKSKLIIAIRSLYPWKMNYKFPLKITIKPQDGINFEKKEFKKEDAAANEKERIVFFIPFMASAKGNFKVVVKTEYSVCKEDMCRSYWGSTAVFINVMVTVGEK